jgi:protoheme IX farnesyltransferase
MALLGTAISSAGAAALNNYLERDCDLEMNRTKSRPIQRGVLSPSEALNFGWITALLGVAILIWQVNLLTGFLSLLTTFLYVVVYTPLKRITWWNTVVGAIPGALPPMGGWAAATGEVGLGAWIVFLILFVWQHPHFYAIAWMYREVVLRCFLWCIRTAGAPLGRSSDSLCFLYRYRFCPTYFIWRERFMPLVC